MTKRTQSWRSFRTGFGLSDSEMEMFFTLYLNKKSERSNCLASPAISPLDGLPPAYVCGAGLDILRDDSRRLAAKLERSGVSTVFNEVPGVIHGFTLLVHELKAARETLESVADYLRRALAGMAPLRRVAAVPTHSWRLAELIVNAARIEHRANVELDYAVTNRVLGESRVFFPIEL